VRVWIRPEAVVGGVGQGDGVVLVVRWQDRQDGPKISSRAIRMSGVTSVKIVGR